MKRPLARSHKAVPRSGDWYFGKEVAARFDAEARTHIPHYEVVVDKCVAIARAAFPDRRASIIDVGSATGYTMKRLLAAGFSNVHGVESSLPMIQRSGFEHRVIHSHAFPMVLRPFDMVLMNWTLHFISDRINYLRDVRRALSPGGILLISDKVAGNQFLHERYHDFKRAHGLTDAQITRKADALRGVLHPVPPSWYFETLPMLGFQDINIIDADYCFATFIAFAAPSFSETGTMVSETDRRLGCN